MTGRAPPRGFALLAVLGGVALVGTLAAGLITTTRSEALISRNLIEHARAQLLVDGAVRLTIAQLAQRPQDMPRNGAPLRVELEGVAVEVAVQEAGGLVDLNTALPALLASAFTAAGWPAEAARQLTEATLAQRQAGRTFQQVDELRLLPGVTAPALERVRALLTVQSRQPGIDPELVPAELRAALPRAGRDVDPAVRSASAGDVFVVRGRLLDLNGALVARDAVVRLTHIAGDPLWLHDWRDAR